METLLAYVHRALSEAMARAFGEEAGNADVAACAQESFGHYQCNSPLRLGKAMKRPPREMAETLIEQLDPTFKNSCSKIEIAGPGFINFTLTPALLAEQLHRMLHDPKLGVPRMERKKVIVEFSSPNIAKELHVGHLRSTIIGDSLARLFEFLGHDVLRLNHLGDWGTQFGMLIAHMQTEAPQVLSGAKPADLQTLLALYRASKHRFDLDASFKKQAQLEVVKLQSGDPTSMRAWKLICEISRGGFQEIYDLLGTHLVERGESFYNPFLGEVVAELEHKGLVTLSEGAKCIFLDGFKNREGEPLPLMIQKSDGGYNYDTTDMAALRYRVAVDRADRIIYVTDNGQSLHFQMIFAAARKAGWLKPGTHLDHVGFGLVLGLDGKKFKTRSGDTEKLIDLLTEAIDYARRLILERSPDIVGEDLARLSKVLGIGAVKYADLASHRTKDYTFSYERMLRFEGNTAVFLLYAYVRIFGIKRKIGVGLHEVMEKSVMALKDPTEISLGLHVRKFGELLESVARDLLPNRLAEYLYELAEKFNAFFRDCRVEGSPEQGSRLLLCELTAKVLKQGLEILGLETVERM